MVIWETLLENSWTEGVVDFISVLWGGKSAPDEDFFDNGLGALRTTQLERSRDGWDGLY